MVTYPPGTYDLEIMGTVGNKSASTTVTVTLVDPCLTTILTIVDPDPFDNQNYILRDPQMDTIFDINSLMTKGTLVDCGPVTLEWFNDDGKPLDSTLFKYDTTIISNDPTQHNLATLYTEDPIKKGSYLIRYRMFHDNYPLNVVE